MAAFPGKPLGPLLALPGGSSLEPQMQFKDTLARCLFNRTRHRQQKERAKVGGATLQAAWEFRSQAMQTAGTQRPLGGSRLPVSGAPAKAGWCVSHQDVAQCDLGGSSDFAVCGQCGLMDPLARANVGLLRTNSLVCKAPAWRRFDADLMGSAVVMDGQRPTSHVLL